jgi:hypothetical protein
VDETSGSSVTTAPGVDRLVVGGPCADRLFLHFSQLFSGRDDVVVIRERRSGDRRRSTAATTDLERCGGADRRQLPPSWVFAPAD